MDPGLFNAISSKMPQAARCFLALAASQPVHDILEVKSLQSAQQVQFVLNDQLHKYGDALIATGRLSIFKLILGFLSRDDDSICAKIAATGSLGCLKYAREQGFCWNSCTYIKAARAGSLKCMQYAYDNDCHMKASVYTVCIKAAEAGSVECLKYAHEKGGYLATETCNAAARTGSLECLKYAHENGCPW